MNVLKKRAYKTSLVLLGNFIVNTNTFSAGGIATDTTLGLPAHVISAPNSITDVVIKQTDGVTKGHNLFHSFSKFNIESGQTVTFTENKVNIVENVISRVTGGATSDINGSLRVTPSGKANFYLINPNGITIGPNGQVDVPGSIHVSTADELKFKDGHVFSTVQPMSSSLSSTPPASFGFLGASTKNNGLLKIDSASLNINQKKAFDVVAGRIQLSGTPSFFFPANIISANQGGEVRLIAIRGSAEISVNPTKNSFLSLPKFMPTVLNAGRIELDQAPVLIRGNGAGKLSIWGGDVRFNSSSITLENDGPINPSNEKGMTIESNSLAILNGSNISSTTSSDSEIGEIPPGRSASITINTTENFDVNDSTLSTKSAGNNNSGNITIWAGRDVIVQGRAGRLSTEMQGESLGKGGDIKIISQGDVKIFNGGRIGVPPDFSSSNKFEGRIGNINLTAKGNIALSGNSAGIFSVTTSAAKAGDIVIDLKGSLYLENGSQINSSTTDKGDSGNIAIVAKNIYLKNSYINAESENKFSGDTGNIKIEAKGALTLNRGSISIQNKSIHANDIVSSGANLLTISAPVISLKQSQITTRSSGDQRAGSIAVTSKDNLSLESSAISTESQDSNGGDISINSGLLIALNNSRFITTVHGEQGNGGNINVNADNLVMETGLIQANTAAQHAKGGNISLNLKALITSGNQLIAGGSVPKEWQTGKFGLNIIQAAAPFGLSGTIRSTAPALNLSGTLANLGNPQFDTSALKWESCFSELTSSLIRSGNGGIPLKAKDLWFF